MNLPIVDNFYLLQKFPGKGGWTYAEIPEVLQNKNNPFGWVKVKGRIDHFELKNYKLMPMGNGKLFLPVKAAIRKQIAKQAGDTVHIVLFEDHDPIIIPEDFLICLEDNPVEFGMFQKLTDGEQKMFIDWIFAAKSEQKKADRMAEALNLLARGKKMSDRLPG